MNVFTASGRLGRDSEVKNVNGTSLCEFALAIDTGYGDRKSTMWVRCNIWGKRAEGGLPQYLVKGTQVMVSGDLSQRTYQKKDGTDATSLDLRVQEIELIGGKSAPAHQPVQQQAAPQPDFDDPLPF